MNFFNYDNPVMQFISRLARSIWVCMLWLLCCVPVFTIGASTAALYYTVEKSLKNDRGYVTSGFFKAFGADFKQATLLWLPMLLFEGIFWYDAWLVQHVVHLPETFAGIYMIFFILMVLLALYAVWVFASVARFHNTSRGILYNSLILMIRHLGVTVINGLLILFSALVVWLLPIMIFLMPVLCMWLICFFVERVFVRYQPEEHIHED